jgi:hypothetical protein
MARIALDVHPLDVEKDRRAGQELWRVLDKHGIQDTWDKLGSPEYEDLVGQEAQQVLDYAFRDVPDLLLGSVDLVDFLKDVVDYVVRWHYFDPPEGVLHDLRFGDGTATGVIGSVPYDFRRRGKRWFICMPRGL